MAYQMIMKRLIVLRAEVLHFGMEKEIQLSAQVDSEELIYGLVYLKDISEANLSIQAMKSPL